MESNHIYLYHTKNSSVLLILELRTGSQNSSEVIIVNLLVVGHHELPPPLLAGLALHLALIDRRGRVEVRKILLQVLVDIVIVFGQSQ